MVLERHLGPVNIQIPYIANPLGNHSLLKN